MSPGFGSYKDRQPLVTEFGPCRSCGCRKGQLCEGGCERDERADVRTLGLCSACITRKAAEVRFPGSKRHDERRNSPTDEEVEEHLGGFVCSICDLGEALGDDDSRRVVAHYDHADRRGVWVGMVCTLKSARGVGIGGCSDLLGRVARGTAYGSERRLRRLVDFRDNPLDLAPFLGVPVTDRDEEEAARRQAEGLDITAVQVAALRAAAGHCCQVCRKPEVKDWPNDIERLSVDHDRHTMRWRGLLCAACNGAMRFLDEINYVGQDRIVANTLRLFTTVDGLRCPPRYPGLLRPGRPLPLPPGRTVM